MTETGHDAEAPQAMRAATGAHRAVADRPAELACRLLDASFAFVAIEDAATGRELVVGRSGPIWAGAEDLPADLPFCAQIRRSDLPVVIEDTRRDPRGRGLAGLVPLGVVAFLGAPVPGAEGRAIGSLCVVDRAARRWSAEDVALVGGLAVAAGDRLRLVAALAERDRLRDDPARGGAWRDRLAAVVGHEFRTPLNAILGMAALLETDLENPAQREMAAIVRQSGETLAALVEEVLALARPPASPGGPAPAPFRPAPIVEAALAARAEAAAARGIRLSAEVRGTEDEVRLGDGAAFAQIMARLVGGSVAAAATGEIALRLDLRADDRLRVEVSRPGPPDPGPGALDLLILEDRVRRLGGQVETRAGAVTGLCLALDLPFPRGSARALPPRLPHGAVASVLAGKRLLVADDTATNRKLLEVILGREGAELTLVSDGVEAVAACDAADFDALLLDIAMPGLDGVAALAEIRARALRRGSVTAPAVAITASLGERDLQTYARAGFAGHVAKPFDRLALVADIARLVGAARPRPGGPEARAGEAAG